MKLNMIKNGIFGFIAFVMISVVADPASALLLTKSGVSTGTRDNFTGTIGNRITIGSSDVTVNALGYEDEGADGLAIAHQIGIWTASGTSLTSATVASGTAGDLIGVWRFVSYSLDYPVGQYPIYNWC